MSQIYKGASISIAAAWATNGEHGFLQGRHLGHAYVQTYELPHNRLREGVEEDSSIILFEEAIQNVKPIDSGA